MDAINTCRMLALTVTPEQKHAMRYLERQGQKFCVEFGTDNAITNARAHWNELRRTRYARRRAQQKKDSDDGSGLL